MNEQQNTALGVLFYKELNKILQHSDMEDSLRVKAIHQLLLQIIDAATQREKLPFATHFARIAYTAHKFSLSKSLQYFLHHFRHWARGQEHQEIKAVVQVGLKVVAELILSIWKVPPTSELAEKIPLHWPIQEKEIEIVDFYPEIRVLVVGDDTQKQQLQVRSPEVSAEVVPVQYGRKDRNANFESSIIVLQKVIGFPSTVQLLNVEVDENGIFHPQAFIIEPDYLIDVSAIASCFLGKGTHPWGYLLQKYLPFDQSLPLLLGNIANFFLDEIMTNSDITFKEVSRKIFNLNPLAYCLFSDRQIKELVQKSQGHFLRLKQAVKTGLKNEGIAPEHSYLEPSFFSMTYGIQGRLDLLHLPDEDNGRTAIVELKSGKPFMPNRQGISASHYIQTLLYDMLIRSAYGRKSNVGCYILYSSMDDRSLRFAPAVKAQQMEALQVRNQLVAIEYMLCELGLSDKPLTQQAVSLFGKLRTSKFRHLKGFTQKNLQRFEAGFLQLDALERAYFAAFSGFIAREHRLAKIGVQGADNVNGLASLWLDGPNEKEESYQRLAHLNLKENHSDTDEPLLHFRRSDQTNPLANFRKGDIVILFPSSKDGRAMLRNQVFKCTVVDISVQDVSLRLRSRQFNKAVFEEQDSWSVEHDMLDSSFKAYYQGLFSFASAQKNRRELLMGLRPPEQVTDITANSWPNHVTAQQQGILDQIIASKEYFLLWGPPGTGKTSVMLRYLVDHLLHHSEENLLLLAYTNRAVDEICEALHQISDNIAEKYYRIGSSYGAAPQFSSYLLQNQITEFTTRKALREHIASRRIVVGTVASLSGKKELLQLISFDRVIIDEASQILEPLLAGLLPNFKKWVLIGDHRQLPAVVTQNPAETKIEDTVLQEAGYTDLGQSLFERLFLKCQNENWEWAFAQLQFQGRMHKEIMHFPAQHFYHEQLFCLPESISARLQMPLNFQLPAQTADLDHLLIQRRLLFFPTPIDQTSTTLKTNVHEAQQISTLVERFKAIYLANNKRFSGHSIGIITPYRAQIAQIKSLLESKDIDTSNITIDTVERYQGGARDVILISFCTNHVRQMETLSMLSAEGVDRKLNVAMTRAREHLVMVGNPEILKRSSVYAMLLEKCGL